MAVFFTPLDEEFPFVLCQVYFDQRCYLSN